MGLNTNWGYNTNAVIEQAVKQEIEVMTPSKKNRKRLEAMTKDLYKLRRLVQNS
jgi:hypothetical protein